MLYEISKEVAAALAYRQVPVAVVFGPERAPANTRERIVFEHDDAGDSFAVTSIAGNPPRTIVRWQAVKVRIYAQDPSAGARIQDHRRRCEAILDRVLVCLNLVVSARKNQWKAVGGTFVNAEDLTKSETWPGAVYELRVQIDRAVFDRKWDGSARPEVTIVAPGDDSGVHVVNSTDATLGDETETV